MSRTTGAMNVRQTVRHFTNRDLLMSLRESDIEPVTNLSVLIVDDSKLARMAARKMIVKLRPSAVCVEAASAAEAVELATRNSFAVALLDFDMPERDGLRLAADLIVIQPKIKIAILSAARPEELAPRARSAGASFIQKPVGEAALRDFMDSTGL